MSSIYSKGEQPPHPLLLSSDERSHLEELIGYAQEVNQFGEKLLKTMHLPSFQSSISTEKQAFEQMIFKIDDSKREIAHLLRSSLPEIEKLHGLLHTIHGQFSQFHCFFHNRSPHTSLSLSCIPTHSSLSIESSGSSEILVWTHHQVADAQSFGGSTPPLHIKSLLDENVASSSSSSTSHPKKVTDLLGKLSRLMIEIDHYSAQLKTYQTELLSGKMTELKYASRTFLLESKTTNTLFVLVNQLPGSVRRQIYTLIGEQHLRSNSSSLANSIKYGKDHYLDKSQRQILKTSLFQISCRIRNKYKTEKRAHSPFF